MSSPNQQTIASDASIEGVGLHTGKSTRVQFRPAPPGTGIRFHRMDLEGEPEIPVGLEHVESTDRGTTLGVGEARAHTVEHLLAAVGALGIDNLHVDLTGPEVPIVDGSFQPFCEVLRDAGLEESDEPAHVLTFNAPFQVEGPNGGSYTCMPADGLRLSATIEFDHPLIRRQYASFDITRDTFQSEVAPARTFGFLHEAEALRERGLALGATLENAVVLDDEGLAGGELRFGDEFVRHKIGDMIGDLVLTGGRLNAHVVAEWPSHAGNLKTARELVKAARRASGEPIVDITKILEYLPHRYPMLLVDRIIDFEAGKRIVGIKNVTFNEPFFQGHYPGHPVMPGVLIIEAMAQVGGLLLMDTIENPEDKVVYFMTLDNVKWRRPVTPGDQLVFELEMLQFRRHTCRMKGVGRVDGQLVAEAEMMARIVDL
jgi:UDP-3-O-[3-hydroxymyristoyl] N-acetylglucosamine deacetylase/3-hydroxyacyl-[acyl-carrier-protein] dehydratase